MPRDGARLSRSARPAAGGAGADRHRARRRRRGAAGRCRPPLRPRRAGCARRPRRAGSTSTRLDAALGVLPFRHARARALRRDRCRRSGRRSRAGADVPRARRLHRRRHRHRTDGPADAPAPRIEADAALPPPDPAPDPRDPPDPRHVGPAPRHRPRRPRIDRRGREPGGARRRRRPAGRRGAGGDGRARLPVPRVVPAGASPALPADHPRPRTDGRFREPPRRPALRVLPVAFGRRPADAAAFERDRPGAAHHRGRLDDPRRQLRAAVPRAAPGPQSGHGCPRRGTRSGAGRRAARRPPAQPPY